ncbi:MAG TPA: hypothetical protein VFP47_10815 [Pyrinomonadaceae bacterium]|nr:hypothetical protein [Pyrinomonadaceae bacterium]
MRKNFLKTIGGAVLAVSTLAVLPQIWVSAREFGKAESTPEFTEGKITGNSNFLFADGIGCESLECRREVAAARIGTALYHDINVALADGFVPVSPCVRRAGVGTMGFHYGLASRIDQNIDPSEPEVLLYLPDDNGVMELVAVEYVFPNVGVVPSLFGQDYHFSSARNRYELHAWIWRHNPAGMFEDWNPKLNCPGFPPL